MSVTWKNLTQFDKAEYYKTAILTDSALALSHYIVVDLPDELTVARSKLGKNLDGVVGDWINNYLEPIFRTNSKSM
jgi:hypothetical protein